mgnify:CR=1 FL=1
MNLFFKLFRPFKFIFQFSAIRNLAAFAISKTLIEINPKNKNYKRTILVLNHIRFLNDLNVLGKNPDVRLLALSPNLQVLINSINCKHKHEREDYFKLTTENVRNDRYRLYKFLTKFIPKLCKFANIDALLTCSFYYLQDQEWDRASKDSGIPFLAIYKENLKYEVRGEYSIQLYKSRGYKFQGNKLLVFDERSKTILSKSEICKPENILVTGMIRIDDIFNDVSNNDYSQKKDQVTLFSFRHAIGGFLTVDKSFDTCFSTDGKNGVVDLFDNVHSTIAKLAKANPNTKFVIKTKRAGMWPKKINERLKHKLGYDSSEIENLEITSTTPAHDLIKNSDVIVGINSTTLLESKLFNKKTIIPFYDEAAGRHKKEIYFQDFFDDFTIASSSEELEVMIQNSINSKNDNIKKISPDAIARYFGYFDGNNCNRLIEVVNNEIKANGYS